MSRFGAKSLAVSFSVAILFGLAGSASSKSSCRSRQSSCPPVNTAAPNISGTAQEGQKLTASTGSWSGTTPMTYAYQWRRCDSSGVTCASIFGATGQSYTLGAGDVGSTMRVRVTATNAAGTSSADSVRLLRGSAW